MTLYFHGKPTCECLYESLPLVEKVMLRKNLIQHSLDIYQIIGGAPDSANTHSTGGAVDSAQYSDAQLRVWRDAGYDAAWKRTTAQGFDITHTHAVARGCPHNGPARYQIAAVDAGYNGLGYLGHAGPDNGPKPLSHRTWQEGIAWMKAYLAEPAPVPVSTVFDICEWNIARPRWYTPWSGRAAEIAREIKDEASVYCFQELFEDEQIATVKAALPNCQRFAGHGGLEFFYDINRWTKVFAQNLYSGIANRWAQEVTLKRVQTGQLVTFFNAHGPIKAEGDTAKARYGQWLAGHVKGATHPVVVAGDFNTSSDAYSPKKELRALGYIGFKEQVAVVNEGTKEFIPKGQDLADIRTHPSGTNDADVTSGLVDLSTNSLESDHRRIEARVTVVA